MVALHPLSLLSTVSYSPCSIFIIVTLVHGCIAATSSMTMQTIYTHTHTHTHACKQERTAVGLSLNHGMYHTTRTQLSLSPSVCALTYRSPTPRKSVVLQGAGIRGAKSHRTRPSRPGEASSTTKPNRDQPRRSALEAHALVPFAPESAPPLAWHRSCSVKLTGCARPAEAAFNRARHARKRDAAEQRCRRQTEADGRE
jgi:hypothetical protein